MAGLPDAADVLEGKVFVISGVLDSFDRCGPSLIQLPPWVCRILQLGEGLGWKT
jgi:hypothetical protein